MASAQRQTNVEILKSGYEDFEKGDVEAVLARMADDIEWIEPEGMPFRGTYRSPAAVRENVFEPALEGFETFAVEPDRFVDGGSTVVALGAFRATTEDGERIDSPFAHVWELEDGRIVRFQNYTDTALWQ